MPTTKSLLEKTILKVGRASINNSSNAIIIPVQSNVVYTYIVPDDGEVTLMGIIQKEDTWNSTNLDNGNGHQRINKSLPVDAWTSDCLTVKKGSTLYVTISNAKNIFCQFVYSVGGGLKSLYKQALKQGDELCLRLKSLLMHSEKHQLGTYSLQPKQSQSVQCMEAITTHTLHHKMGSSADGLMMEEPSNSGRAWLPRQSMTQEHMESTPSFHCVKGKAWAGITSAIKELKQRRLSSFTPNVASNNFCFGGVA